MDLPIAYIDPIYGHRGAGSSRETPGTHIQDTLDALMPEFCEEIPIIICNPGYYSENLVPKGSVELRGQSLLVQFESKIDLKNLKDGDKIILNTLTLGKDFQIMNFKPNFITFINTKSEIDLSKYKT